MVSKERKNQIMYSIIIGLMAFSVLSLGSQVGWWAIGQPAAVDPYEQGYNEGYNDGLGNKTFSLDCGDRYNEGYDMGFEAGNMTGWNLGNETGWNQGFEFGNMTGWSDGYNQGWQVGNDSGYEQGWIDGYDQGYFDANATINQTINETYWEAFNEGYNQGYNDGLEQCGASSILENGTFILYPSNIQKSSKVDINSGNIVSIKYFNDSNYLNMTAKPSNPSNSYVILTYQISQISNNLSEVLLNNLTLTISSDHHQDIDIQYVKQINGQITGWTSLELQQGYNINYTIDYPPDKQTNNSLFVDQFNWIFEIVLVFPKNASEGDYEIDIDRAISYITVERVVEDFYQFFSMPEYDGDCCMGREPIESGYYKLPASSISLTQVNFGHTGWIYGISDENDELGFNYTLSSKTGTKNNYALIYYQLSFLTDNLTKIKNITLYIRLKANVTQAVKVAFINHTSGEINELTQLTTYQSWDNNTFLLNIPTSNPDFVCQYNGEFIIGLIYPKQGGLQYYIETEVDAMYCVVYVENPPPTILGLSTEAITGITVGAIGVVGIITWIKKKK
jgi:hypothetical protein